MMTQPLSKNDIDRLLQNKSSVETQMDIVNKLTGQYTDESIGQMSLGQLAIANEIFQKILQNAELQVRTLLAQNLSNTNKLPTDIVKQIMHDVYDVANPLLEHSPLISEVDLLAIIKSSEDEHKLLAIARRENVSEQVSDALVETRMEPVVNELLHNETASIRESSYKKIIVYHMDSATVMDSLLQRNAIPVNIIEKAIDSLSVAMQKNLEKKYGNLQEYKEMKKALDQSVEVISLRMHGYQSSDQELIKLINYLDSNQKLQPFSALCMGNLQLFEISLSRMVRVPVKNIHMLLKDPKGLKTVYDKAELPENLFEAVQLAVQAINELQKEFDLSEAKNYKRMPTPFHVMNRMMQLAVGREIVGTDYLYAMMRHSGRKNIKEQTADN